nr:hypothetical protein [Tanacetum cinerariifolium]
MEEAENNQNKMPIQKKVYQGRRKSISKKKKIDSFVCNVNKSSVEYTEDNSNDEDNEDSHSAEEEQNTKDSESVKTPHVKKRGSPKKIIKANENKSSSDKRQGRPRKSNDESKKQTIGSKRKGREYKVDDDDDNDNDGTKKMKKKSKISVENNKNSKIHTRTTPTTLCNAMAILNGDRKKCLHEMGFGSMIGMGIHELSRKLDKCYNVHQDLRSVRETLNEGLLRFPDCKKLNKLVKKFEEDFNKKDLVRNNENDDTTDSWLRFVYCVLPKILHCVLLLRFGYAICSDHDHYQEATCAHHEDHMMHDSVQLDHVVDSHADSMSDSNIILYDQYVKDNEVPVVHSDVSSVPADAFMMIYDDMCEPHDQSVSYPSRNTAVQNSLTTELATYKEHVELVVVQNVQGRPNRGQGMNPRGRIAAGYRGAQNRVRDVNQGQARPSQARTVKCYNCNGTGHIAQENRVALDTEQLLFLAGGQDNAFDDDVDEQPIQDLALNVDNVFQADDCDAFDSNVDEAPTAQTMFMANLSSADPVTDEARPSYDSDILSEYVKNNEVPVVHNNVSSVPNDAFMLIYSDMCEPPTQSVSSPSQNTVVKNSLTAELATYKEHVELYEQRAKFELTEREQKINEQLSRVISDRNFKKKH